MTARKKMETLSTPLSKYPFEFVLLQLQEYPCIIGRARSQSPVKAKSGQ